MILLHPQTPKVHTPGLSHASIAMVPTTLSATNPHARHVDIDLTTPTPPGHWAGLGSASAIDVATRPPEALRPSHYMDGVIIDLTDM